MLARTPRMGRVRDELAPGLRSFPIGDYLIFYRNVPKGIAVVRVLSGYRDIESLFGDE
jgi:toxin ParE1/3/4